MLIILKLKKFKETKRTSEKKLQCPNTKKKCSFERRTIRQMLMSLTDNSFLFEESKRINWKTKIATAVAKEEKIDDTKSKKIKRK